MLDMCAFSDLMREHPAMDRRLAARSPNDRVLICSIVRGEVLYGLHRLPDGRRRQRLAAKASALFREFSCAPVPEGAADRYAELQSGRPPDIGRGQGEFND
ncbi:MAG: PIN domain-containing protein [Phycisphaerales bacterium]|nr:PIN domain-containing protein [Phycisphaerales bacterium]